MMPMGFGDAEVIDDELTEEEEGRRWENHGPQWVGREEK